MIKLETKRLIIRDPIIDDLESHHELLSNDKVMYYLQDIKTNSLEESEENLLSSIKDSESEQRKYYFFKIIEKNTLTHIGDIGYTVTDSTPIGKFVHLGYFSYDKFWGNGYVTEAMKEVIRFAFEENNVYRITTGCLLENIGSERVMKKCGFTKEAEHIDYEWHDGKAKTRVEYRLLKSEWEKFCEVNMEKKNCSCCNNNDNKEIIIGDYVCYCNHVTEKDIINAIENGASSVEDVIKITGAMKNSNCAVNNPKGTCCYSDIVYVFNKHFKPI